MFSKKHVRQFVNVNTLFMSSLYLGNSYLRAVTLYHPLLVKCPSEFLIGYYGFYEYNWIAVYAFKNVFEHFALKIYNLNFSSKCICTRFPKWKHPASFWLTTNSFMYTVCSFSRFVSLYSKYFRFKTPLWTWWDEVKLEQRHQLDGVQKINIIILKLVKICLYSKIIIAF